MIRTFFLCFAFLAASAETVHAQNWAEKMFAVRSHDFGTIARGAKAEFAFELTNRYTEDVHIASVRSSCGCTTPRIEKDTLKTYEKGAIIAKINSSSSLGKQSATLTVTIDRPQYAQVMLSARVYIYHAVVLEPSSVMFGSVAHGATVEKQIRVRYSGRSDWKIEGVKSDIPHLTGSVTETLRQGGRTEYVLNTVLDKDAPPGYLNGMLWLTTNDPRAKQLPVEIDGRVVEPLTVSPASLFLGVLPPGQSATKRIVVRGQKPFRITKLYGDCECIEVTAPAHEEVKSLHLVPVKFTARQETGKVTSTICIETDEDQTILKVPAFAMVGSQ